MIQAYLGTFAVVGANLLLRPLAEAFKHQSEDINQSPTSSNLVVSNSPVTRYGCQLICKAEQEGQVLSLLLKTIREQQLALVKIHSKNIADEVELRAEFVSKDGYYELEDLEEVVGLLKSESKVSSVSWLFLDKDN